MDYFEHMARRLNGDEELVPGMIGDKRLVRLFAAELGVRTPALYYSGSIEGFPEVLPEEFVLKPEFASTAVGVSLLRSDPGGNVVDLLSEEVVTRGQLEAGCRAVAARYEHVGDPTFAMEELLRGRSGEVPAADVRCYSFQGIIGMVMIEDHMTGRARAMYFDGDFHPFPDVADRYGVAPGAESLEELVAGVTPSNWREILAVARRVSTAVPTAFCRVDLYDTALGVYLGEITLYPGTFFYRNRKTMSGLEAARLGRLWDDASDRLLGTVRTW